MYHIDLWYWILGFISQCSTKFFRSANYVVSHRFLPVSKPSSTSVCSLQFRLRVMWTRILIYSFKKYKDTLFRFFKIILLLFNYSCLHFLPTALPHSSQKDTLFSFNRYISYMRIVFTCKNEKSQFDDMLKIHSF